MSKRLIAAAALVLVLVIVAFYQPLPDRQALREFLEPFGIWAVPFWTAIYAVGVVAAVPGIALTAVSVWLFGFGPGCGASVVGASVGACGAFVVARFLGRGFVASKLSRKAALERLDRQVADYGAVIVLLLRLLPVLPFNLLNYLCGLTGIRLRAYAMATLVGILPGALVYCYAAEQVLRPTGAGPPWRDPRFLLAMLLLGLFLVALPLAFHRGNRRAGGKLLERMALRLNAMLGRG